MTLYLEQSIGKEILFLIPDMAKGTLGTINELSGPWQETFRFLFNLELAIKLDCSLYLNKKIKTTDVQKFKCIGKHHMTKWLRNKEVLTIQLEIYHFSNSLNYDLVCKTVCTLYCLQ